MGLYDQFLGLTQQGLDTGTQIAMQRAQQPTMADVFMDRFRAGGQDQMARQKMAEDARMNEARLRDMQANRQFQAMQGASNYATDETAPAWESLQRSAGVETPVGGPGLKQKQLEQALAMLQEKLEAQKGVAGQADATKRYGIDVAANKPATPVARINAALQRGQLSPEEAEAERRKATNIPVQPFYAQPMPAMSTETGKEVLIQPKKTGGVDVLQGLAPVQKGRGGSSTKFDPNMVMSLLDEADEIVKKASGSLAGAAKSKVLGLAGISTEETQANAQMASLQAQLMMNLKRMEGPQSDKDIILYREQAGKIGDPMVPIGDKQAALRIIRRLTIKFIANMKAANTASASRVGQATKMKDGTYSDGKSTVTVKDGKIVSEK